MTDFRDVKTTEYEQGQAQRVTTFKVTQIIWLILGIVEGLIALRIIFKLIAVNPANGFAEFLYNLTALFVAPFASLTSAPAAGGMVLEISSIIAMIVYLLVAWAIAQIITVLFYRPRGQVSVRQTVVAEHVPSNQTPNYTKTITTEKTVTPSTLPPEHPTTTEVTEPRTQTPHSL